MDTDTKDANRHAALIARMVEAAKTPLTVEQTREQRVSFVKGMMGNTMTEKEVREQLAKYYG